MKNCPQCQRTYANDMDFCPQDGSQLIVVVAGSDAQLAAGLSRRFRIVRKLGAGGMGTVFLAEQIGVGNRPVALKVLNRKLLDDPEFLLRFQNEAGSTGRIRHPNVVTIYEAAQADDGTAYIAMEFLDGETLRDALKERGALPLNECADILQQTAHGLNAAHKLGIIHRDLKPDNIFLTQGEAGEVVVKVVDFGIAKLRESATHTLTGMVLGTPAYMSSEQASGIRSDQLDLRSDVYSLGIVVYEMLTGSLPFHSDTPLGYLRKHMMEAPPPLRTVTSGMPVPAPVEAVVMSALAKNRDDRFASVLAFAHDFSRAASASTPSEPLATTRVIDPSESTQPPYVPEPAEKHVRKPEPPRISKPVIDYIVREQPASPQPAPVSVPSPVPIPPVRQHTPPVSAKSIVAEAGRESIPPEPSVVPQPTGHGSNRFFKVGFWILGISEIIGILETVFNSVRYFSHYELGSWFTLLTGIAVGAAFTVINIRFLARRRYSGLLWLSLAFAVMGMVANNVFWIAMQAQMEYHVSYGLISVLAMWRALSISTGLPLSSLLGPFVSAFMGRVVYFAVLTNLDLVLKTVFLILAIRKYRDGAAPSQDPALAG